MAPTQDRLFNILLVSGLLSFGLGACSSDNGSTAANSSGGASSSSGGSGSGGATSAGGAGSGGSGSGGATTNGGTTAKGGTTSSGGTTTSGGTTSSGGATTNGGSTSSGGTTTNGGSTGSGGATTNGGATGLGGTTGSGGSTGRDGGAGRDGGVAGAPGSGGSTMVGTGGAAGAGAGGTTGGCQKGGFKGSDLVIFGESFYDWSPPYIKQRMEENARKAGSLGASDSYRQYAVAGQNMSYIANTEYNNAVKAGKFTKVVMDGGGIDCMSSSCPTCPDTFKGMLDKLVTQGVDQLIYTRYPEPGNPPGSNASLKGNLDALMPKMETVCKGYTGLKCYWVDLRPVWPAEKDKYTTDGLHPTKTGGDVVGDAIWAEMVKQCMAQ